MMPITKFNSRKKGSEPVAVKVAHAQNDVEVDSQIEFLKHWGDRKVILWTQTLVDMKSPWQRRHLKVRSK